MKKTSIIQERLKNIEKRVDSIEKNMFTKKDHEKFVKHLDDNHQKFTKQLDDKHDNFVTYLYTMLQTKEEHQVFEEHMDHRFNESLVKLDEIMGEVQASRNERIRSSHRFLVTDDQVANHEKRIRVLEKTSR